MSTKAVDTTKDLFDQDRAELTDRKEETALIKSIASIYEKSVEKRDKSGMPRPDFSGMGKRSGRDRDSVDEEPLLKSPHRAKGALTNDRPNPNFSGERPHTSPDTSPNRNLFEKDSPRTHLARKIGRRLSLGTLGGRNLAMEMQEADEDLIEVTRKSKKKRPGLAALITAETVLSMVSEKRASTTRKATSARRRIHTSCSRRPETNSLNPMYHQGFLVQGNLKPLHIAQSKQKSYPEHARYILSRIKPRYRALLNVMIRDKGLGCEIDRLRFDAFYKDLTELVALLDRSNLDDYVLRHHDEDPDRKIKVDQIKKLSHKVVEKLVSFGFKGPEGKLLFWSGGLAQEKAKELETGVTDEEILLLQALWGLDKFVCEAENGVFKSFEDSKGKIKNSIHTKLIVAFSSILAEYAEGKEVDYYLGYPDKALNVSSAFWQGELPVLREMASKVNLYYIKPDGTWTKDPVDINSDEAEEVLDSIQIRRIDYGKVKGPRQSDEFIDVRVVRTIATKWKMLTKLNRYMRQAELLSAPTDMSSSSTMQQLL